MDILYLHVGSTLYETKYQAIVINIKISSNYIRNVRAESITDLCQILGRFSNFARICLIFCM